MEECNAPVVNTGLRGVTIASTKISDVIGDLGKLIYRGYLVKDLADKAISFIADAKQVAPNKPFFMYYCTGAMHAPHHVPKEWADQYAGVFDDGWEAYREKTFAGQKELGVVPQDAELSRNDHDVNPWDE